MIRGIFKSLVRYKSLKKSDLGTLTSGIVPPISNLNNIIRSSPPLALNMKRSFTASNGSNFKGGLTVSTISEMDEVKKKINEVEKEIAEVANKINQTSDKKELKYFRDKEIKLRDKEIKLLKKNNILLKAYTPTTQG